MSSTEGLRALSVSGERVDLAQLAPGVDRGRGQDRS